MTTRSLLVAPLFLLAALSLGACSSDADSDTDGNNPGGAGGFGGDDGSETEGCKGDKDREGAVCVETLEVSLVDEEGAPLEGITVFCCGTDICSEPVQTDAEGRAFIEVGSYMIEPAFKVVGGGKFISFAAPLPKDEPNAFFEPTTLIAFPEAGVAFEPGTDQVLTSNGVSLEITAETEVEIDELSLPDEEDQLFKAVRIPLEKAPPIGAPSPLGNGPIEAMYGLAPLSTSFDPPAKLSLPNSEGWEAGTPVHVYVHGVEIDSPHAPYAGWGKIDAGAKVSEDGETIVFEAGIPLLSTIGLGTKINPI